MLQTWLNNLRNHILGWVDDCQTCIFDRFYFAVKQTLATHHMQGQFMDVFTIQDKLDAFWERNIIVENAVSWRKFVNVSNFEDDWNLNLKMINIV